MAGVRRNKKLVKDDLTRFMFDSEPLIILQISLQRVVLSLMRVISSPGFALVLFLFIKS